MFRNVFLIAIVLGVGLVFSVQGQDVGQRTKVLVSSLDKTKYKKKEKKDIKVEVYVDVRNEAIVKDNPAEYSGLYVSEESGYRLELRVAANGTATGNGFDTLNGDESAKASFTLKDARVDGALLTGTKVYSNGQSEKFEAVFCNRTVSSGTNPDTITNRDTAYGLGFVQSNANWTNRVFLEFKHPF